MSSISRQAILTLYKRLLRLHQKLPTDMKTMGLLFIREEFKKHKGASDEHAKMFIEEWTGFARNLEEDLGISGDDGVGKTLSSKELNFFNEEQVQQLRELHRETTKPPQT